jgi:putative GTP pyrophosphokinase
VDMISCVESAVAKYVSNKHLFERFRNAVVDYFKLEPSLNTTESPIIHTLKSRLKDENHLKEKIIRKWNGDDPITADNIFSKVTDLAGVRVLHLYQDQFPEIHHCLMRQFENKEWHLNEEPKAYSWDPEACDFFRDLGLSPSIKESYYTSIHYVIKPRIDSEVCCEIQVRTLFEEIWGEIDHSLNYPNPTDNMACKEQIRVLSKLVSTGTRLADAIFRTKNATTGP